MTIARAVCIMVVAIMEQGCIAPVPIDVAPLPGPPAQGLKLANLVREMPIDLSQPLSADALAATAVITNPDLAALRAREAVAEAQVFAAGLFPDPSFSWGFDRPQNGMGLVTAVTESLGIDFAALARRPALRRQAGADVLRIRFDIAWAEWLTGEQVRLLAVQISYLERVEQQTDELRRLTEGELGRVLRAVSRGELPASELETRRLAATDAADRDRSAELALAGARLGLNRLLGLDPGERLAVAEVNLSNRSFSDVDRLFLQAVGARADLKGLRAMYEGSSSAIDSALLGRYPLPAVALNISRDTGAVRTLGPAISVNVPLWNRGRGEVSVARASRAQLRAEYAARLEAARADIADMLNAIDVTRLQLNDVAASIAPLVPQVDAAVRAAARGDLSASSATASRLALLDRQIVQTRLAQAIAEYEVALEIAVGRPLEAIQ